MLHRLILLAVFFFYAPVCIAADQAIKAEANFTKTKAGKVLNIEGQIIINAPREAVWAVMTDCPNVHKFVPALKKCEVLSADPNGHWDIRRHTGKGSFPLKGSISEFKSTYTYPSLIKFTRTGGDYDTLDGRWVLESSNENATKLSYFCQLSASIPVPNGIIKKAAKKRMRKTLKSLKETVETTEK